MSSLMGTCPYDTLDDACEVVENGGWSGSGQVTDGNLVVHFSEVE